MDQIKIGKFIAQLRKQEGLTQMQLAERLNITDRAVSKWETGKTQPDIDTLKQIAEFFAVSIERIIYGKEKKRFHFSVKADPQAAIELGSILRYVGFHWQSHPPRSPGLGLRNLLRN